MKNLYFAVWKPRGITSNHLLNRIRRALGSRKVGHAGTLDPLAEGVLVVATGRETSRLTAAVDTRKEYVARVRLGATSTTDDDEGVKTPHLPPSIPPRRADIEKSLASRTGDTLQVPPAYSALKIKGVAAYKRVRAGEELRMAARPARIDSIEIVEYAWPVLTIRVVTGKGVYIRSLARDIGEDLATGGYLEALTRTRVGEETRESCLDIDTLEDYLRDTPGMVY